MTYSFAALVRELCLVAVVAFPASCATYRVVAYLDSSDSEPGGIVEGSPGVFYVQSGGVLISSITVRGKVTILASFPDPPYIFESSPGATAANGRLYSSVEQVINGGSGNVFSVTAAPGSELNYSTQRIAPTLVGNLPDGKLFGTAYSFSRLTVGLATVDLNGDAATFFQFPYPERPYTPIYGSDGNYYGVSQRFPGDAYLYRVTPTGAFTNVATLPFIVTAFLGGGRVIEASDGNFYGIQSTGLGCSQSNQHGAVYQLTPSGQYTILHDFGVCGNGVVNALIEASDGKLYGAIEGNSVLFSLSKSGEYKVEFKPTNATQGICQCTLVQGSDGIIYGTALNGGGPYGFGVIFALDAGLPLPQPHAREFEPRSGPPGTPVRIWGNNLLQSAVNFNGAPATDAASSGPNYVWATVPPGATTGPITVTTPGGTSTTIGTFMVQ